MVIIQFSYSESEIDYSPKWLSRYSTDPFWATLSPHTEDFRGKFLKIDWCGDLLCPYPMIAGDPEEFLAYKQ